MAVAKSKQKGPSRLIIYTLVGAVAIYAYVLQTTPDKTTKKTTKHTTIHKTVANAVDGITDEDLNAHFARYAASAKDPFVPAIALRPSTPGVLGETGGQWSLTGVNTIDGVTTATVENPASNDSVFLKVGDSWNGLRVTSITADSVAFQNALGQPTTLSFPGNDVTETGAPDKPEPPAPVSAGGARGLASGTSAGPLPSLSLRPMPVPSPPAITPAAATADQGGPPPMGGGGFGGFGGGGNPGDQGN